MEADPPFKLTFLHFNDAYHIEPNKQGKLGVVNFYDFLERRRKKHPTSLLAFSGDCFAPSKLSRIYKGQQMAFCINRLGIDVACYGNHDFDFPPEHVQTLVKQNKFPWLLGNVKYVDTGKNLGGGHSYYIKEHEGVKIGFMGLAGPDFCGRLISCYKDKLRYIDIKEHAKKMCEILREKDCDLIIALNHCRRPVDEALAKAVPQIDLILGGHDHQQMIKQVDKIPILKSGSDFQFLSEIHIKRRDDKSQPENKDATVVVGRRWIFEMNSFRVPKAQNPHPQLQNYIKQLFQKKEEDNKQKSLKNNKPKQPTIQLPESDCFVEYGYLNNRPTLELKAGLSAEICFAKYMAFKRKCFYLGYKKKAIKPSPQFVHNMLQYIYKQVRKHDNIGKSVLYSPGICNVSYLVQTCNFIYLPSHFLVGVTNIKQLQMCINSANEKGYKCYAVVGYDPFFQTQLCAWIKFIQPPPQYIKLIREFEVQNVVMMSVHDQKGDNHGDERNSRLLAGFDVHKKRQRPQIGDIYINFIKEGDEVGLKRQLTVFGKIIEDRPKEWWGQLLKQPKCQFIHDWQSGIDTIGTLEQEFKSKLSQYKIRYFKIVHYDSWMLYLTAYHLGKSFISYNYCEDHQIQPRGIVFNQYIMSNPSYELNYGYLPILYWQFYPKNQERIKNFLTEEELTYKRWFNMHKGTHLRLLNKDAIVINTSHDGKELGKWVTKYAPLEYKLKYLPFDIFLDLMSNLKMLIICQ